MPSSGSTSTSANCAPNECNAYFFLSSDGPTSPRASTGCRGRPPIASSFCRNARHAASTAEATLAAVIEPPDRGASGISVSPRSNRTFSYGTPSVSAATWAITVYVPPPMSTAPLCTSNDPSGLMRASAEALV